MWEEEGHEVDRMGGKLRVFFSHFVGSTSPVTEVGWNNFTLKKGGEINPSYPDGNPCVFGHIYSPMGPHFTPFTLIGSGPMLQVESGIFSAIFEICSKLENIRITGLAVEKETTRWFLYNYRLGQTLNLATMSKQSIHFSEGDLY